MYNTLVSPAIGATLHTFFLRSVLMTELLPTFGYPMNPTLGSEREGGREGGSKRGREAERE